MHCTYGIGFIEVYQIIIVLDRNELRRDHIQKWILRALR